MVKFTEEQFKDFFGGKYHGWTEEDLNKFMEIYNFKYLDTTEKWNRFLWPLIKKYINDYGIMTFEQVFMRDYDW